MKEFKQLAGQTLIYGLGTMLPRFLNYILLTVYFTNTLFNDYISEYGKVTELYAYIAFLMVVLTYGMETTYFRYATKIKDRNRVFSSIQTLMFTTTIIFLGSILIFTQPIADALKYSGESYFIRLLALILSVETLSAIPFAKLRIENRPRKFAILKIIQVSINIILLLGIYNIFPAVTGSTSYILNAEGIISSRFIFISNLIASSVVLFLLLPELKGYSLKAFDKNLVRPLLIYGLPLMVSGLAGVINETLDRMVYKHIVQGKQALIDLGIYGANYKIGGLLLIFIQMFRYAAEPYFFNKSKEKDSKRQYAALMNIFVGVVLFMGLIILLFLDIFQYFIGANFREGLFVVPYIVLAYVFSGILFNLSVWYKLTNMTFYALIIMLVGATITVVINFVFVPVHGYKASAIAHLISAISMVILSYILSRKYYAVEYDVIRIASYLIFSILIYIVAHFLQTENVFIDFIFRGLLVLLFVIFVAWKEKIIPKRFIK